MKTNTELHKFTDWLNERRLMNFDLQEPIKNLPDHDYPFPVQIDRYQFIKFRNDFVLLSEFAALICEVDVKNLCAYDMLRAIQNKKGEK